MQGFFSTITKLCKNYVEKNIGDIIKYVNYLFYKKDKKKKLTETLQQWNICAEVLEEDEYYKQADFLIKQINFYTDENLTEEIIKKSEEIIKKIEEAIEKFEESNKEFEAASEKFKEGTKQFDEATKEFQEANKKYNVESEQFKEASEKFNKALEKSKVETIQVELAIYQVEMTAKLNNVYKFLQVVKFCTTIDLVFKNKEYQEALNFYCDINVLPNAKSVLLDAKFTTNLRNLM
uniref:TPR_REGION domain-containing protein n=1 Tax=Meloidogyne hapla TaxID=6305 RepID=A0A1I8BT23_MELHA